MTATPDAQMWDGRPELREEIAALLATIAVYCGTGQQYAALGNDEGLQYSLRCAIACIKNAIANYNDLVKANREAQA